MTSSMTTGCRSACRAPDAPRIVREAWRAHERFPEQTRLLRSHEGFRAVSRELLRRVEGMPHDPVPALAPLEGTFEMWMAAMRSHERYEEGKLYPYLARRYDTTMQCLVVQHEALHRAVADVRSAFEEGHAPLVADALRAHRRLLVRHLDEEEEVVIPMLLELSPREFAAYVTLPIGTLMRRFTEA